MSSASLHSLIFLLDILSQYYFASCEIISGLLNYNTLVNGIEQPVIQKSTTTKSDLKSDTTQQSETGLLQPIPPTGNAKDDGETTKKADIATKRSNSPQRRFSKRLKTSDANENPTVTNVKTKDDGPEQRKRGRRARL